MVKTILDYEETNPLEEEVQNELLRKIKTLDSKSDEFKEVMDSLTIHNLRLIAKYANGMYSKKDTTLDDVIALAIPGLQKAIMKFDPSLNVPFAVYCKPWIQVEIHRGLAKEVFHSHLSSRDYDLLMSYYACESRLLNETEVILIGMMYSLKWV